MNINIQNPNRFKNLPNCNWLRKIALGVLSKIGAKQVKKTCFTVRFVGIKESRNLNFFYRKIDKATNILSFVGSGEAFYLGDLVLCVPIIRLEAVEQSKNLQHHFTHLLIHGLLHLSGYDHQEMEERSEMEYLEIMILKSFNIENPYE